MNVHKNARLTPQGRHLLVQRVNQELLTQPMGCAGKVRFATDSPLEQARFELVWGFSCQVSFWFGAGSLFGAGKPFFVPSPAIRFAERAEGVKGPKR
jgi:hypothetical protein